MTEQITSFDTDSDSDSDSDNDNSPYADILSSYHNNQEFINNQLKACKNNPFTIVTINLDSLKAKHALLNAWLISIGQDNSNCLPDAILCQETRLHSSDSTNLLNIPGYTLITSGKAFNTRGSKGGLAIYLKDSYNHKLIQSPDNTLIWESLFIEVNSNILQKPIYILNVYRYQRINNDQFRHFQDSLIQLILPYTKRSKQLIIGGDFNLNYFDLNRCPNVTSFYNALKTQSMFGKINQASRITTKSATAIDNLFCNLNDSFSNITSGIITAAISDHLMCFINIPQMIQEYNKINRANNTITTKSFHPNNIYKLNMHIFKAGITEKMSLDDINENYNILTNTIQEGQSLYIQEKTCNFNRKKHKIKHWISIGIIRSINKKNQMLKKFIKIKTKNNNPAKIERAKNMLNSYKLVLNKCIRNAKRLHYDEIFKACDSTRSTWLQINNILNRKLTKRQYPEHFLVNNIKVNDKTDIANKFNSFFNKIGKLLAEKITTSNQVTHSSYLQNMPIINKQLHFKPVTKEIISKIIKEKLKAKNSCGQDNISCNLLKKIEPVIANPLTKLINQCLNVGMFPDKLKIAKVIPLHKKEDIHTMDNYRPISLLPAISKIFERILYDQIYDYMSSNNLFYKHQYGFRQKHSTEHAAQELVHTIHKDLDNGDIPITVFLDLSKAFDTLNHSILFEKLTYYGIKEKALEICKNYLSNRKQYTQFNGVNSNLLEMDTGVPQGSILGPLFFLIYINDIKQSSEIFHSISYADDTTLYTTVNRLKSSDTNIEHALNDQLNQVNTWLCANKLSLNVAKTKFMIYSITTKKKLPEIKLKINNTSIDKVKCFNFLGITIDSNLNWKEHIKVLSNKLSKTTGILNMLKSFIPQNILKTIYNSLFLSYTNYGISCWGYTNQASLKPLVILQKRAIRIITHSKYNSHTAPLFKRLNTLTLLDTIKLNEFKLYYKFINNYLPHYHMANLNKANNVNNTRAKILLKNINTKSKTTERDIFVKCPQTINSASDAFTNKAKTHSYKSYVKYIKHYMTSEYTTTCNRADCPDIMCTTR